jgi:hypothetical protein
MSDLMRSTLSIIFNFDAYFLVTRRRKLVWRIYKCRGSKCSCTIHLIMTYRKREWIESRDERILQYFIKFVLLIVLIRNDCI